LKKILIIKLSAIGDVVMSLSMIDALQKYYGNVHITWLCGKIVAPVLHEIEGLDKIITLNESNLFSHLKTVQLKELLTVWKKLSFKKFDKIIIGHTDWRYRLLSLPILAHEKVSFGYKRHHNLPLGTRFHGVDYVQLATDEAFIKSYDLIYPNIKLEKFKNDLLDYKREKILLFPGGANNTLSEQFLRRWDILNYQKLANILIENEFQVIIAGARSDNWVSEYFNSKVLNLIGQTNLLETISLIRESDLVVTHDSGPLHLSLYLTKKKTIALFGPVLSEARIPENCNEAIVMKSKIYLNCMPCYDGHNFTKCEDNVCMKNINVEDVYNKVIKELKVKK